MWNTKIRLLPRQNQLLSSMTYFDWSTIGSAVIAVGAIFASLFAGHSELALGIVLGIFIGMQLFSSHETLRTS